MEALGRGIACLFCVGSMILLLAYHKTSAIGWQNGQTIRAMSKEYVRSVRHRGTVTEESWSSFQKEIQRLGSYDVRLTVYERKRYEDDSGAVYFYSERDIYGTKRLPEGSYVRLTVFRKDMDGWDRFWYGDGCIVFIGGRIT